MHRDTYFCLLKHFWHALVRKGCIRSVTCCVENVSFHECFRGWDFDPAMGMSVIQILTKTDNSKSEGRKP